MPGVIWEDVVATKHRRPSTARTSDGTAC
jgi:hypothetical protein